jgi:hypothetical protein
MILYVMLVALGFLIAMLIALLLAPAFWRRAERLTARRLEQSMPMSIAEAEAERDQIRASYAIIIRRLEAALSQEKMRSARQLVKISRLQMEIADLNDKTQRLHGQLEAEHNAASVLRRTIATRVPELNRAAQNARQLINVRDREINTIVNRLRHREEALAIAQRTTEMQQAEIARLRQAMEMSGAQNAGRFKLRPTEWTIHDYRAEYDRLNVELSKLRERVAVAYDREANQIKELRTELQQLADQIVTTASALPESEPQQAIAHDGSEADEPRRLSAPAQEMDSSMRSIDAIIANTGTGPRAPTVTEPASAVAHRQQSAGALSRAAAAPKRLAQSAMQKMAGLTGAMRDATGKRERGNARGQAPAAPTPGEVSAARLLGGAAVSEGGHQTRRVSDFSSGQPQGPVQGPAKLLGEHPAGERPSQQANDAQARQFPPIQPPSATDTASQAQSSDANTSPPARAQAAEPEPDPRPRGPAPESEDDGSLYDRYRSAKPTSGKLRDNAAAQSRAPVSDNAENPETSAAASDAEGEQARAATEESDHARKDASDKTVSSGNGAAAPDSAAEDQSSDTDASSGSLLDRLRHVPESETR